MELTGVFPGGGQVDLQVAHLGALSALAGAIIGGLVAFAGQALLRRGERKALAHQLARGLAGEMAALIEIVEHRKYVDLLRGEAKKANPDVLSVAVTRNYFKVFETNAGQLGLLAGDLPEVVASFYVRASAVVEDFTVMSQPAAAGYPPAIRQAYYGRLADLLEKTMEIGRDAIAKLRK